MPEARSLRTTGTIAALLVVFAYGAWEVMVAPLSTGSAYPNYSSLRSDPLGSKALFDSLARLPEFTVTRTFKDPAPPNRETTLLLLGLEADEIVEWPVSMLEQHEKLLKDGGRVVLAFEPTRKRIAPRTRGKADAQKPAVEQRWNLKPQFILKTGDEEELDSRDSALYFEGGSEWSVLWEIDTGAVIMERPLAGGTLVLVANGFLFSNQSLAEGAETEVLASVLGDPRNIVFDEKHLGVVESGSVAVLGRKYNLEPALAALLVAAILFVWRASSSFLPLRQKETSDVLEGRDSHAGLAAMLRRSIAPAKLMDACVEEWRRTGRAGAEARLAVALTGSTSDPAETYRKAARALKEKHD